MKLNVNLFKDKDDKFKVRVSCHVTGHIHDVNREVYNSYSEARQITSPSTRDVVKTLVQGANFYVMRFFMNSLIFFDVMCRWVEKEENTALSQGGIWQANFGKRC